MIKKNFFLFIFLLSIKSLIFSPPTNFPNWPDMPFIIEKINDIKRECRSCTDHLDNKQLINNIIARKNNIVVDIDIWFKSPESQKNVSYFVLEKAKKNFANLITTVNQIISIKSQNKGGISELIGQLTDQIIYVDAALPDFLKLSRKGFMVMIRELITAYDNINSVPKPQEYDRWLIKLTSVKAL